MGATQASLVAKIAAHSSRVFVAKAAASSALWAGHYTGSIRPSKSFGSRPILATISSKNCGSKGPTAT